MAHVGEESLLLVAALHRSPKGFRHLLDLLLVINLDSRVDEREHETAQLSVPAHRGVVLVVLVGHFICLERSDADQVGLSADRRCKMLRRLLGRKDLTAEG